MATITPPRLGRRRLPHVEQAQREMRGVLHPGLPFYISGFMPIFWLLGLGYFTFAIAGAAMGVGLLLIRPIRVPKGFGIWLLFVGWTLISALTLDQTVGRYFSFGLRASVTLGATTTFLFVYNVPKKYLPTSRVLGVLGGLFVFVAIFGGYAGLLLGEFRLNTPFFQVLPGSLRSDSFVSSIVRPPFAQTQDFLGFPINRPALPFGFTNAWASTLAPLIFATIAAAGRMQRFRRLVIPLAFLAVVPIAISANRALWITIVVLGLYVIARRASDGQLLLAIRFAFVAVFAIALILISPLGDIVSSRATSEHSIESRGDIYTDVLERVPDSPLLGFGAPIANPQPFRPAIGTHGAFWTALFSQGIPGAVLYVGFWVTMTVRTGRNVQTQEQFLLHLAVATSLITSWFYDHLPATLPIMMICAALVLRERRDDDELERRRQTVSNLSPPAAAA